jgi:hypothetical protein
MTKNICKLTFVFLLATAPVYAVPIGDPVVVMRSWEGNNFRLDLEITTVLESGIYVPIGPMRGATIADVVTSINGQLFRDGNTYTISMGGVKYRSWMFPNFAYLQLNIQNFGFHVLGHYSGGMSLSGPIASPLSEITPSFELAPAITSTVTSSTSVAVPEPSTMMLLVSALYACIWRLK